jgi:hypothetical protein
MKKIEQKAGTADQKLCDTKLTFSPADPNCYLIL